ncbi:MAG: nucleotide pyrophosphohydrolase [Candidatus Electrothrix sp. AR3]|nr:nucleotide pyrophosphohydrolase [Candidatus Electrothrix sp. AR3]
MPTDSLEELSARIHQFAQERDWEQFHSPKNLSMALIVEAAELLEHFQWLSQEQSLELSPKKQQEVALEMADILIYLIRLADRLDIDLLKAARQKILLNAKKYPAQASMGKTERPTEQKL